MKIIIKKYGNRAEPPNQLKPREWKSWLFFNSRQSRLESTSSGLNHLLNYYILITIFSMVIWVSFCTSAWRGTLLKTIQSQVLHSFSFRKFYIFPDARSTLNYVYVMRLKLVICNALNKQNDFALYSSFNLRMLQTNNQHECNFFVK